MTDLEVVKEQQDMLKALRAPMPYKQMKGKGGMTLDYITQRQAEQRLDDVLGMEWKSSYEMIGGQLACTISVMIDNLWVGRTDVGTASTFEKEKGTFSDAFKRAAECWGVGRFLYPEMKGHTKAIEPSKTKTKGKVPVDYKDVVGTDVDPLKDLPSMSDVQLKYLTEKFIGIKDVNKLIEAGKEIKNYHITDEQRAILTDEYNSTLKHIKETS